MLRATCRVLTASLFAGCFGSGSPSPPDASTGDAAAVATEAGALDASPVADASSAADPPTESSASLDASVAGDAGCGGDGGPGTFTCTGSLATARNVPGAALLSDGRVLVAGGWNAASGALTSAEIYDPSTGVFRNTGAMAGAHLWAGWTAPWPVLSDGSVLAAGGLAASGGLLGTAELYDPSSGIFSATGTLGTPVLTFDMVTAPDGDVLLVGGYSSVTASPPTPGWDYTAGTNAVQSYDPSQATFGSAGTLAEQRLFGCNLVTSSGSILAIGGWQGVPATFESNIEEYDATSGQWTVLGALSSGVTCGTAAFELPSAQILVDGAYLLDPLTLATTPVADAPTASGPMMVQLATGDVLAAGGTASGGAPVATAQVYAASTGQWTTVGSLNVARTNGRALLLPSGNVLVVGGSGADGAALTIAEIYHP